MICHNCGKEYDETISLGICQYCGFDNSELEEKRTAGIFFSDVTESYAHIQSEKEQKTVNATASAYKWLQPGAVVNGKYEILETIGAGGFGITYKARDIRNNVYVALKEYFQSDICNRVVGTSEVLLSARAYGELFEYGKERLLHEARVVAKFQSSNIVRVLDFFEANNTSYMVMEYLPYPDLRQYLERRIHLDTETIIGIGVKLCEALEEIHSFGVIHRDIAPDNIIVTEGNDIKIIDFGSARLSRDDIDNRLIAFKAGYAPPEQYEEINPKHDTQREWTDVYAVGATLYSLFTGRVPIESTDRKIDVNNSDQNDPLCYPSVINQNIPEYIDNTIMKAMAINIHERFQTVTELKKALLKEKKVRKIEEVRVAKRRNRRLGITGGFLVAAIALFVGMNIYSEKRKAFEFLDEASVSIWYPIDENANNDVAKENMIKYIVEELKASDKFDKVSIDIKGIDRNDYGEALKTASAENRMPTIFEYTPEIECAREDIEDIIPSEKDCYMAEYFSPNTISTGINVPVIYFNYLMLDNPDEDISLSFGSVEEILEYCSAESIAYNNQNEEQYRAMFADFDSYYGEMTKDIDAFLDGKALVYLSDTSDMGTIMGRNAAQFDMAAVDTEPIVCTYTDAWAMKECSDAEEKAGKAVLRFFLSNTAQTSGYIENGIKGIPLENNTVKEFTENKSTLSDFDLEFKKYTVQNCG